VLTLFLWTTAIITDFTDFNMTRMHNPAHPGAVLREYLGNLSVTEVAARIGVSRATLQRILNGTSGISPDMAYRLGAAFSTSPELWAGMQLQYDLYQAGKIKRPKIEPIAA
jgi:addiction module HigA family antidote